MRIHAALLALILLASGAGGSAAFSPSQQGAPEQEAPEQEAPEPEAVEPEATAEGAAEEPETEDEEPVDLAAGTPLPFDQSLEASIAWADQTWQTFLLEVPEDAVAVTLNVEGAGVDLDLFARHGAPIESYDSDAEHSATSFLYNDTLRITRASEPPLKPGTYWVDVAYNLGGEPRVGKRRVSAIPFTISASLIRSRIDGRLAPAEPAASQTDEASGWFRTFVVEVPEGAPALRIDLDQVLGDLDLVARPGKPILDREETDHLADSVLGRETLLIDAESDPPLASGTWYVNVYDPYELDAVRFTAHVRFDREPPPELLAIPGIRPPTDGLDRALLATVAVLTYDGGGSGTLLASDGWILTNHHVVEDDSGNVVGAGELVIGLSLDPRLPPAELFRGSVVVSDRDLDLALVKIETGLYGQELAPGYRFPYLELGDPDRLRVGDPLTLLGFPGSGTLGSLASISLTRGVVSGFDSTKAGVVLKTDAEIGSGNSGGAALDASLRLIGVPMGTVEDKEVTSQLGYVLPVTLIPREWRRRIGG
jgi:hypothetical protein